MRNWFVLALMSLSFLSQPALARDGQESFDADSIREAFRRGYEGEVERPRERWNRRRGDFSYNTSLRVGDEVINLKRSFALARVIDIKSSSDIAIRFLEGSLRGKVGDGWDRNDLAVTWGCGPEYCVGDEAYNIERQSSLVTVVGLQGNGEYVLRFEEGSLRGKKGMGWSVKSLAAGFGCTEDDYCVGDRIFNLERSYAEAEIVAIQPNDEVILEFMEGTLRGKKGANWDTKDLAHDFGCGDRFCVGDYALNRKRDYARVQILGVAKSGDYVIEFLEGSLRGKKGGGWSDGDLAPDVGRGRGRP